MQEFSGSHTKFFGLNHIILISLTQGSGFLFRLRVSIVFNLYINSNGKYEAVPGLLHKANFHHKSLMMAGFRHAPDEIIKW